MVQGRVEIAEGKRFLKLKRWMIVKTGWTLGNESHGAMLVLKPSKKARWKPS